MTFERQRLRQFSWGDSRDSAFAPRFDLAQGGGLFAVPMSLGPGPRPAIVDRVYETATSIMLAGSGPLNSE
jgi:hypothetical protein